ncbi:hypothetical protein J6590_064755 [Homalodisca vitripennis]|nr:hypothetical protein J6590_064755 [Homalodisca vitripennis]
MLQKDVMTTHSQDKTKMWGVLWMVSLMTVLVSTDLPDQDCPDDCDCHYFRINWVTDCSESNLTSIPTVEEGLSLNVYVLNMNANNLDELQPFPAELKVRSLLLAENTLSMVDKENFSSLMYLIDLDLSSNNIRTIHPDAFMYLNWYQAVIDRAKDERVILETQAEEKDAIVVLVRSLLARVRCGEHHCLINQLLYGTVQTTSGSTVLIVNTRLCKRLTPPVLVLRRLIVFGDCVYV